MVDQDREDARKVVKDRVAGIGQRVRQALTASGVPEGWKWHTERDVTDEYVTSLIAPDGTTVYVGEDDKAIAWLERLLSADSGVPYPINVVFDGPPSATSGRFVEVETDDGRSIRVGEWIERGDGLWSLRIDCSGVPYVPEEVRRLPEQWRQEAREQIPEEYTVRGLENKYLAGDNQAAGLDDAAEELEFVLNGGRD